MTDETFRLVVAVSVALVGASVAVIAWAVLRLVAEAHRLTRAARDVARALDEELPPTLHALEEAATRLGALAHEGKAPAARLEHLMDETEATMAAVRQLSSSVHELVRGPAETVSGVRRSARMVGGTLASGAGRLRRAIVHDGVDGGADPDDPGGG